MSTERDPLYILGYQKGFASAAIKGQQAERERIINTLKSYFDLTVFSTEIEGASQNAEWGYGFQAALALVRAEQ